MRDATFVSQTAYRVQMHTQQLGCLGCGEEYLRPDRRGGLGGIWRFRARDDVRGLDIRSDPASRFLGRCGVALAVCGRGGVRQSAPPEARAFNLWGVLFEWMLRSLPCR